VTASADCPNPENHCLDPNDVFVSKRGWNGNYIYVEVAAQQSQPDAAGEAKFFVKRRGEDLTSKWFYRTRAATAADIQVGKMVVMLHRGEKGVYQAPRTRAEAYKHAWWMARITNVNPMSVGNYVIVSGGYRVAVAGLRAIEGDDSKGTTVGAAEDAHFLAPEHWIASDKQLRDSGYQYVYPAAALQAPSPATKNEGEFVNLRNGKVSWTAHAWRTRPATQADLKVGQRVFMLHRSENKAYQKPRDRLDSFKHAWWTSRIADTSSAYKGVVTVAGGYQVAVDALRVAN
jgi:hypothetical protein